MATRKKSSTFVSRATTYNPKQKQGGTVVYHTVSGQTITAQRHSATTRSVARATARGAFLGANVGSVVVPGFGTGFGAVTGGLEARNKRIEKLAKRQAASRGKSITASHAGRTGHSPSKTVNRPGGAGKANRPTSRGKKTNYVQDSHGRFAGSR